MRLRDGALQRESGAGEHVVLIIRGSGVVSLLHYDVNTTVSIPVRFVVSRIGNAVNVACAS